MGIRDKKCLYEEVIVPMPLYRAEAWGMRSAERRKVNTVFKKFKKFKGKCLRSSVEVSRMERVRCEEK